jgi:GxxExxY protein
MHTEQRRRLDDEVTHTIIGCAHRVSNALGSGFLEKVYENALALEIRDSGLVVSQQARVEVYYKRCAVGFFCADLVVENRVMIELKAVRALHDAHAAQCLNYLKAT